MVSTILVPLDCSPAAEAVLPYAEAIARATGASIRLLGVAERVSTGLLGVPADVAPHLEQRRREIIEQYLNVTAAGVRDRGASVSITVEEGDPVSVIVAVAAGEHESAMIVMATHGRGGLDRLLIGSVADKVMRLAANPTLLVRPDAVPTEGALTLRRLMVPLDGSALAEGALAPAAALAQALGASLTLARVEPWVAARIAPYGYLPDIGRFDEDAAAAAEAYLEEVQGRMPRGTRFERIVLRGSPAEMLVDLARNDGMDLTVMTTHGWGGLRRLVLGSVADRMVRAGAPVLLIRPPAVAAADRDAAADTRDRVPSH